MNCVIPCLMFFRKLRWPCLLPSRKMASCTSLRLYVRRRQQEPNGFSNPSGWLLKTCKREVETWLVTELRLDVLLVGQGLDCLSHVPAAIYFHSLAWFHKTNVFWDMMIMIWFEIRLSGGSGSTCLSDSPMMRSSCNIKAAGDQAVSWQHSLSWRSEPMEEMFCAISMGLSDFFWKVVAWISK